MKKTITINLAGIIFNIEEDAYQKLSEYLESIKKHYGSEDGQEIIADIESSISEKFREKISKNKQVITLREVEEVIEIMGTVEEIGAETEDGEKTQEEDPRIKKLYRDPDDVVVAGVCSGLAAYFAIDPVIVRIIFIILAFLNGFGILAYLILWVVTPKALNSIQKLEMQGKPINLKKLEQAIKEKSEMIKKEGKQALEKVGKNKTIFKKILELPIEIIEKIFNFFRLVISKARPILAVIFGIGFVSAALLAIFGLIFAAGMLIFNVDSPLLRSDITLSEIAHNINYQILVGSIFLVASIPFVFMLFLGITLARRKNSFRLIPSLLLILVWFLGLSGAGIFGVKLAPTVRDIAEEIRNREMITRNYDFNGYTKIRVGADAKVKVKQGEEYSLKVVNDEESLENFKADLENGELTLRANRRRDGICILCFEKPYEIEITLPKLESFIAYDRTEAEIQGFKEDIRINAGEAARVKAYLEGQALKSYIAGTSGRIEILGSPRIIEAVLEGRGRLDALDLETEKVDIKQNAMSRIYLGGKTEKLDLEVESMAKAYADDLISQEASAEASGNARIEVWAIRQLKAVAKENGIIFYSGDPEVMKKVSTENGVVKKIEDSE